MIRSAIIPWMTRTDLDSFETGEDGQRQIAIKDHVRNAFYHFGELEFAILESLKSRTSLEQVQQRIEQRFGIKLSDEELLGYIQKLGQDNLLVALRLGDGQRLYEQHQRQSKGQWVQRFMGLLSIKFPGFHPGEMLSLLKAPGWICFHPFTILMVLVLAAVTVGFAILSIDTLFDKTPTFREMLTPSHIALMLVGFIVAKVLHELGHGLACQRAGHECNEMGILLLVGIPCMYCDVSDLWTEKNHWQRILVSLAGVFVEIALALICFWGWYFSVDGMLHRFLFGMMLLTSVNTLFVNGNPLMRYDGYYALSDFLRIPNLAAESKDFIQQRLRQWFVHGEHSFVLHQKKLTLGAYGLFAGLYRYFIMFAIGWGVWMFFDLQQLRSLGTVAIGAVALMTLIPVAMSVQAFAGHAWQRGLKVTNVTVAVALLALCYLCLAHIEFRQRVYGTAEIQLADALHVFAPAAGQLRTSVVDGQFLQAGDAIATIIDDDLQLEMVVAAGEVREIELQLKTLEFRSQQIDTAGDIEFWSKRLETVTARLTELRKREESMNLTAPSEGIIVTRRLQVERGQIPDGALEPLDGDLFSRKNREAHVTRGENLCYVANPETSRGFLKIDETEIELVKINQEVRVYLPNSDRVVSGTVTRIAMEGEGEEIESANVGQNFEDPIRFFRVEFDFPTDDAVRIGSQHLVVIECKTTTTLGALGRWWRNSFWY